MKKMLVFGSSQAASLYFASDKLSSTAGLKVDWLVTPANITFNLAVNTGAIEPPASYLKQARVSSNMQKIGGQKGIFIASDYDVIVYSAFGLRPHPRLKTHPAYALERMPVSNALLDTMIAHHPNIQSHFNILSALRTFGFKGQIVCEQWVRPCMLKNGISDEKWRRSCDAEAAYVEKISEKLSVDLLPRLPNMDYITDESFVTHPNYDGVHGNAKYANQIAELVISRVA